MAAIYSTALKNTNLNDVVSALGATGKLVISTAGMATVLATLPLANPVGSVASGVLTFTTTGVSASASASGTAAAAKFTDGTNDVITGLTVGTSGTDIILSSTAISSGQTVNITSGSITHG